MRGCLSVKVHPAELSKQSLTSSGRVINLLVSGANGLHFCLIILQRDSLFLYETMSSVVFVCNARQQNISLLRGNISLLIA